MARSNPELRAVLSDPLLWLFALAIVVPLIWAIVLGRPPGPRPAPVLQSTLKGASCISAGILFVVIFITESRRPFLSLVRAFLERNLYPRGRLTVLACGVVLLSVGTWYLVAGLFG